MPEGDTIFRAARTLDRALTGRPVTRFETAYAHLARVDDEAPLAGRLIESVSARGKHLLMAFAGDLVLRTHMRMTGSWHVYRPGERWRLPRAAMRIVVATDAFEAVAFDVPDAEFLRPADLERGAVGQLGPDLLAPAFDVEDAVRRLRGRADDALGEALLDQRVVAGIGNVFRSEVLFLQRLHPWTRVSALGDEALRRTIACARHLLAANVRTDVPWRDARRRTTGRDDPSAALWVYGRHGRPCRVCGTPIVSHAHGPAARRTWWCPRCQPSSTL